MVMTQNGGRLILMALLATCTSCTSDSASLPSSAAMSTIQPAAVTIMRSGNLSDSDPPAIVKLNGAKIAELGAGESHTNRVGSGPMILTVSAPSSSDTSGYVFTAEPGKSYRIVVSPRIKETLKPTNSAATVRPVNGAAAQAQNGGGPFKIVAESF